MKKINLLSVLFACTLLASCTSNPSSSSSSSSSASSSSSVVSSISSNTSSATSTVSSTSTSSSTSSSSSSSTVSSTSSSSSTSGSTSSTPSTSTTPIYDGKIFSIDSKNFQSLEALTLSNVKENTQYDTEFTFSSNGSFMASQSITQIDKIEVLVYGTYDNLKMYAAYSVDEEKLITATTEEKAPESGTVNNVLYTYSFETPTDSFYLTNPSTYNVQVFEINIYYKGEVLNNEPKPEPEPEPEPTPVEKNITIARAVEIGNTLSSSRGKSETTYVIEGIVTNISGKEVTISQDDATIIAYVPTPVENLYMDYTVKLEGYIQNYYGKIELVDFTLVEYQAATYSVSFDEFKNGSITATKSEGIAYGEEVTLTVVPNEGYKLLSLSIDDELQNVDANNSVKVTLTQSIKVKAEFVSNDVVIKETKTLKYVISDYEGGTQYAENEAHVLDDNTTVYMNKGHFTTEMRFYSSASNDSTAIIESKKVIQSITMNIGNKANSMLIYVSEDGENYELFKTIEATSSYKNYTVEFGESNYKFIKLDASSESTNQLRVKDFTLVVED